MRWVKQSAVIHEKPSSSILDASLWTSLASPFLQSLSILDFAPSVGNRLPSAVFPCHINDGIILGECCITRDVWQVYRAPGAR